MATDAAARPPAADQDPGALVDRNRTFYTALWSNTGLCRPERFNTWPLVSSLVLGALARLEIGPGLRPRLAVAGTSFVDLCPTAVARLNAKGGLARTGEITALPFADASLDLVAAFDVVEHAADDARVFRELARVLKPGGRLVFSVPLHPARWTTFDTCVGHARRYEPAALVDLIARHGLTVEQSAPFGMQPNQSRLLDFAVLGLTKHHAIAMRLYNWIFFPLGLLLQKPLRLTPGMTDLAKIDEVLVVCVRDGKQNA